MGESVHRLGSVLIVDDDDSIQTTFRQLLSRFGFDVVTAANGRAALEVFHEKAFDVIITDLLMPSMSGIDLLKAIRQQDLDVPVIILTGVPALESAIKAVEYGAFQYLVKPVDVASLSETVSRAVHVHRLAKLRRELARTNGLSMQLGDLAALEDRFAKALDHLWVAFQPIVDWGQRRVFGYEALVRSDEPTLPTPADLFHAAERLGLLATLGRRIRADAARQIHEAPTDSLLFVNVHAGELNDDELLDDDAPLSLVANRVILEITERFALDKVVDLESRLKRLRRLGFRIAVDDLGAGYAGLTSFSHLNPEFAKLDMSLVQGVHNDAQRRSIVRGIGSICTRDLGIQVICEGVEQPEERDVLAADGLTLFQGYLFAKPSRGFVTPRW